MFNGNRIAVFDDGCDPFKDIGGHRITRKPLRGFKMQDDVEHFWKGNIVFSMVQKKGNPRKNLLCAGNKVGFIVTAVIRDQCHGHVVQIELSFCFGHFFNPIKRVEMAAVFGGEFIAVLVD